MHINMDSNHSAGTVIGVIIGIIKYAITLAADIGTSITIWNIFDTAVFAFVGGMLGWVGAEIMKGIKKWIKDKLT